MNHFIEAIKKCFDLGSEFAENSGIPSDFSISEWGSAHANKVLSSNDLLGYSWIVAETDYVFVMGRVEPCAESELEERIEEMFSKFLNEYSGLELYAARQVVIDNMIGLEICGAALLSEDDEEGDSVFYALYLSDDEDGFFALGFSEEDADIAFDELGGAARMFYRTKKNKHVIKDEPVADLIKCISLLSHETKRGFDQKELIRNTSFEVEDGKFNGEITVVKITKNNIEHLTGTECFGEVTFKDIVENAADIINERFDVTGFTVTNFKDGRFGATLYPVVSDSLDEDIISEHDHAHDPEDLKDQLEEAVRGCTGELSSSFDKEWECGAGLIVSHEEGGYYTVDTYSSEGGALKSVVLNTNPKIESGLNEIGNVSAESDFNWNTFFFAFDKSEDILYSELFNFVDFFDKDDESAGCAEYLKSFGELFYNEVNKSSEPIFFVTFKIEKNNKGELVIKDAPCIVGAEKDIKLKVSLDNEKSMKELSKNFFEKHTDALICKVTVFPAQKIGIESADEIKCNH